MPHTDPRRLTTLLTLALLVASLPAAAGERTLTVVSKEREPERPAAAPDAVERLRGAVAREPRNRKPRLELVRTLRSAGRLDEALDAARDWRAHDAYDLVAVRMLGDLYAERGNLPDARRVYSAVAELLPGDAAAQRALATVLKQTGDLEAAYDRLREVVRLAGDDPRLGFELADLAQRLGRNDEAKARLQAIADDPTDVSRVRYPAQQRLAQLLSRERREALKRNETSRAGKIRSAIDALAIHGGTENAIRVYLTWDTDRTDVDLWVTNPMDERITYSNRKGFLGDALHDDVTRGYGPESYTAPEARPGTYRIDVNYYRSQQSNPAEARGEVVVLLHEGTAAEERHVLPYRLFEQGQTVTVATVEVK